MRSHQLPALPLWLALLVLPCGGTGRASPEGGVEGPPETLEELMDLLANGKGVRARFRESKHLSLLTEPLETEGVVHFSPPDLLARHTIRPGKASVVVRGGQVAFTDETGHQVIKLGSSGVSREFIDNLSVLLRGDIGTLRSRYQTAYEVDGASWRLDLKPRSRVASRIVESIRVEGRGAELRRMHVRESNGDYTDTVFFEIQSGIAFNPEELDRIFSLGDPTSRP